MAPLVLKIKGNKTFSPFSTLTTEEDLSKTWRLCTKVKDSLENGSRLENLSWRLWFKHNSVNEPFKKLPLTTARKLSSQSTIMPFKKLKKSEPVQPLIETTTHLYEPQTNLVELDDLLNTFHEDFNVPDQNINMMADGWDFGVPSPNNPYYSPPPTNDLYSTFLNDTSTPSNNHVLDFDSHLIHPTDNDTIYISSHSIIFPPLPQSPSTPHPSSTTHLNPDSTITHDPPNPSTHPSSLQPSIIQPIRFNSSSQKLNTNLHQSSAMHTIQLNSFDHPFIKAEPYSLSAPNSPPKHFETIKIEKKMSDNATPICTNCGATTTPLWRRSADDELLCNACGLYQKLHNAPRPKTLKPHNARKDARDDEGSQLVCSNCSTTTTPLWRRDEEGAPLCNACGLYLKLHNERRPLSMKTDVIKKRQRYESTTTTQTGKKNVKKTKNEPILPQESNIQPLYDMSFSNFNQQYLNTNTNNPLEEIISTNFF